MTYGTFYSQMSPQAAHEYVDLDVLDDLIAFDECFGILLDRKTHFMAKKGIAARNRLKAWFKTVVWECKDTWPPSSSAYLVHQKQNKYGLKRYLDDETGQMLLLITAGMLNVPHIFSWFVCYMQLFPDVNAKIEAENKRICETHGDEEGTLGAPFVNKEMCGDWPYRIA